MVTNPFFLLASISAFGGVAMGAFGAHGLRSTLTPELMMVYQTAVNYQMWHALGLGIVATLMQNHSNSKLLYYAGWCMFGGIIVFSGSLYLLSISGTRWLGAITPLGGMSFLIAWALLAIFSLKSIPKQQ